MGRAERQSWTVRGTNMYIDWRAAAAKGVRWLM
jgi:hypothetical protein